MAIVNILRYKSIRFRMNVKMFSSTRKGLVFATLAGCMAALASISAKIATNYEEASAICYRCQRILQTQLIWPIFHGDLYFMAIVSLFLYIMYA